MEEIGPGPHKVFAIAVAPYIKGMPGSRSPHPRRVVTPETGSQALHPHLLNSVIVPLAGIAIAAYLLGSIPTGYLLYRIFRRQDIRSVGSGNIGATNVLRAGGTGLGLATFALDVLKGCTAVWLGGYLASHWMPGVPLRTAEAFAAVCAVLGHMFPVWLRFRGGKGVATGFGVFLVVSPWAALAAIGVFAVVLALSRYVSVASILAAFSFPIFAWLLVTGSRPPFFFVAAALVSLLIIVKHHQNIRRLFAGTEVRIGDHKLK
jgi:glycerol-3-phosphate acyltransferase PlsY